MSLFNLSTFIKPSLAFKMIKDIIEHQLNSRPDDLNYFGLSVPALINDFDTIYNRVDETIKFKIIVGDKVRVYPFLDAKKLVDILKHEIAKGLKNGDLLDVAIIKYRSGICSAEVYYTTATGDKLLLEQQI